MKRLKVVAFWVLLVVAPVLAAAQSRTPPSGGASSGTAVARGGESGSSSSTSSGGSSTSSSAGSAGSMDTASGGMRSGGVGSGAAGAGMSYVSPAAIRSDGARSGETAGMRARGETHSAANVGQPVPAQNRPRGDRPVSGYAVPRGTIVDKGKETANNGAYNGYYGYTPFGYEPFGYGYYGFSYYDPWFNPYFWSPYYSWGWDPSVSGAPSYVEESTGGIKLKVKPKDAEVYVDGYYQGPVDAFDGALQSMRLKTGTHRLEIRAKGYESLFLDVRVIPGRTVTYSGELKKKIE